MSILLASAPASPAALIAVLFMLIWAAASVPIMWALGVFRRRTVVGPVRLGEEESGWILLAVLLGGVGTGAVLTIMIAPLLPMPEEVRDLGVNAVLFAAIFAAVLAGNLLLRGDAARRLGIDLARLPRGLSAGGLTLLLIVPLVYIVGVLTLIVLTLLGFEEPTPHVVLQRLHEHPDPWIVTLLVVSAVVLAPLGEELVFRGMLQTILVRMFGTFIRPTPPAGAATPPPEHAANPEHLDASTPPHHPANPGDPNPIPLDYHSPPPPSPPETAPLARWTAISATSVIFAAIHNEPAFLAPLFVLSLALGYLYERTGNLWIPIGLHAAFNGFQILVFTQLMMPG